MEVLKGIDGLTDAAIEANLDSWDIKKALSELVDNKIDVKAEKIMLRQFAKDGIIYLAMRDNGIPFIYQELVHYLGTFRYHKPHLQDRNIGLKGMGRFWAFFVLLNWQLWENYMYETIVVKSRDRETKKMCLGKLTIRKGDHTNEDVYVKGDLDDEFGNVWYDTEIIIPIKRDISIHFEKFGELFETSYPFYNGDLMIVDEINDKSFTYHSKDVTYVSKYLDNQDIWGDMNLFDMKEVILNVNNKIIGISNNINILSENNNTIITNELINTESARFIAVLIPSEVDKVPQKMIYPIYTRKFLLARGEEQSSCGINHDYGGLHILMGKRYIVTGNRQVSDITSSSLGKFSPKSRGSSGLIRPVLDLSNPIIAKEYGVKTNKSDGVKSIEDNEILNPNHTRASKKTDGVGRLMDKSKCWRKDIVPHTYDFMQFLLLKLEEVYDKVDGYKNSVMKAPKVKSNKKDAKSVLKQVGKPKVFDVTHYYPNNITKEEIVQSSSFGELMTEVLDVQESIGIKIFADTQDKLMGHFHKKYGSDGKNNKMKYDKECLEKAFEE